MHQLDTPRVGAGGEIQITDAMADLIGRVALHGFRFDGTRYDCGNKAGFLAANIAYAMDDSTLAAEIRTTVETLTETIIKADEQFENTIAIRPYHAQH